MEFEDSSFQWNRWSSVTLKTVCRAYESGKGKLNIAVALHERGIFADAAGIRLGPVGWSARESFHHVIRESLKRFHHERLLRKGDGDVPACSRVC